MSPIRKPPNLTLDDIPLLEDVVEPDAPSAPHEAPSSVPAVAARIAPEPMPTVTVAPAETIPVDILSEVLTERITALTDRLLRDASAEIHATLVNKVWEKLREEIPELVEAALRENGGDNG